jgi:hypothetical protein
LLPPERPEAGPLDWLLMSATQSVRITVDLDPEDHRALKIAAAVTGRTISDIVRRGLTGYVQSVINGEQTPSPPPSSIPRPSEFALPTSEFELPLLSATEVVGGD